MKNYKEMSNEGLVKEFRMVSEDLESFNGEQYDFACEQLEIMQKEILSRMHSPAFAG